MFIVIVSIFYFTISTILPTIFLFKRKKEDIEIDKIKILVLYPLAIILHIVLLLISFYISIHKYEILGSCGLMCSYYTSNSLLILLALITNLISNIIFYILTKRTLIKLLSSKFKYIIIITYIIFEYCALIFGILTFYGFSGIYVIKNPILSILRIIISLLPLIIYPLDILVIDKIKGNK